MANLFYKKMVEGEPCVIINNKIYRSLINILKSIHSKTNQVLKIIDNVLSAPFRKSISEKTKVNKRCIMFITFQGDYTCNPKAIANECIKRNLPYDMYWVVKDNYDEGKYPDKLKLVKRGSYEFYEAVAKAHVIVDNTHDLPRLGVHKKENQYLLQTWHGSLGIKRLDGNVVMGKTWQKLAKQCQKDTNYCISNSDFEDKVFHTSYWKNVPVLKYGHARNDLLFERDEGKVLEIKNKVYDELGIARGSKLALYAPTHCDGAERELFVPDYAGIIKALEEKFGGTWYLGVRLHSRQKKSVQQMGIKSNRVINATFYDDMQELIITTDFGITDYSSWIFDYMLMSKPAAILADDIADFKLSRDFYYPIESTPFPIAETSQELIDNILSFDLDKYDAGVKDFLKERGCIEDGHASERIVDKIIELVEGK